MDEKKLLAQLNKLKKIKPDSQWQKDNREVLLRQIFGPSVDINMAGLNWFRAIAQKLPGQAVKSISQPAMAVILILVFMFGGGVLSIKAARDTKPGDSFYIAKIFSEKTQLALTFNEKNKVLLGFEFAGNRAQEITQVLAEPDNQSEKEEKVEKLVSNFRKEIRAARARLERISPRTQAPKVVLDKAATGEDENLVEDETGEEDKHVFSANLGKEDNGIQISEQEPKTDESPKPEEVEAGEPKRADLSPTTTPAIAAGTETNDPQLILQQAGDLLNQENYDATWSKLEEADQAINKVDVGQVKGEAESATSTIDLDNTSTENSDNSQGDVLGAEEKAEDNQADNNEAGDSASTTIE
jgi:hypothetical protein